MTKTTSKPASAPFIQELRRALRDLYDPDELRKSPLRGILGVRPQGSPLALQDALLQAIESLKPGPKMSRLAKPWRTYNTLLNLYVQQFSQEEVAATLGLSTRQLRRQEQRALQVLADSLWIHYDLQGKVTDQWPIAAGDVGAPGDADSPSRAQELEWLERSSPTDLVDISELLQAVLKTVAPLLQALQTQVELEVPQGLPRVAVQSATMRQALLNILTAAVRCAPGGCIVVEAETYVGQVSVSVYPQRNSAPPGPPSQDHLESLEMARQLVALSGGSLEIKPGEREGSPLTARLALPGADQVALLAVDDNADTLQLFQRYLAGSRYRLVCARDPQQALALVAEVSPQIIVLDVMLPGIDGWELLGRLREHPKTWRAPIIVCTILPEEQLALTLGAAAFLRKPVSRNALLAALDQQADSPQRGSC